MNWMFGRWLKYPDWLVVFWRESSAVSGCFLKAAGPALHGDLSPACKHLPQVGDSLAFHCNLNCIELYHSGYSLLLSLCC